MTVAVVVAVKINLSVGKYFSLILQKKLVYLALSVLTFFNSFPGASPRADILRPFRPKKLKKETFILLRNLKACE